MDNKRYVFFLLFFFFTSVIFMLCFFVNWRRKGWIKNTNDNVFSHVGKGKELTKKNIRFPSSENLVRYASHNVFRVRFYFRGKLTSIALLSFFSFSFSQGKRGS